MAHPLHIVDAFTDHPFAGNPAGVVQLDEAAEAEWMQAVAAELNLADTAFLVPRADGDHDLVVEAAGPGDHVEVAVGHRVERAGADHPDEGAGHRRSSAPAGSPGSGSRSA